MADAKTNEFESMIMNLVLRNEQTQYIGDANGLQPSGTAGSLYISLHTAALSDTSDQSTSEATYAGYARVAVPRTAGGWTQSVAGSQVSNAADIVFAPCTAGSDTVTYFGIGTDSGLGAGHLLYWGQLSGGGLAVSSGITPQFATGALTIQEQ